MVALATTAAWGQAQGTLGEGRRQATRNELEQAAKAAEEASLLAPDGKTRDKLLSDAAAIRQRLRNGDFLPGDRIYMIVVGDSALTDTFTVRGDRRLQLPNLPDISLSGVLDSELASHLTQELGRYLKTPSVTATGLVRLTLTGGMARNGFLTFPVDQAITDVLMTAGGLGPQASLDKTEVKRAGKVIITKREFQDAVRSGRTIGDLALRDGDEINVPLSSGSGWTGTRTALTAILPLLFIVRLITNRGRGRTI